MQGSYLSSGIPHPLWALSEYWSSFAGVRLTEPSAATHPHVLPRSRKDGTTNLLPLFALWGGQGKNLNFSMLFKVAYM